jgi:hypothetical protein
MMARAGNHHTAPDTEVGADISTVTDSRHQQCLQSGPKLPLVPELLERHVPHCACALPQQLLTGGGTPGLLAGTGPVPGALSTCVSDGHTNDGQTDMSNCGDFKLSQSPIETKPSQVGGLLGWGKAEHEVMVGVCRMPRTRLIQ